MQILGEALDVIGLHKAAVSAAPADNAQRHIPEAKGMDVLGCDYVPLVF
jgi:hypothetical protein